MGTTQLQQEDRFGPYQVFILFLCILVIISLAIETFVSLPPDVVTILNFADWIVCFIFLADFMYCLFTAESKSRYFFRWGWIDLLSSIPAVNVLRLGRFVRVMRIFRLLRGVRSARILGTFIVKRRAQSLFLAVSLLMVLTIVISSILVLEFEQGPGTNIKGAEDAIWWSITTMTTVGYGDHYPVTTAGRMVAILLMAGGLLLFGTFTGLVASWFLADSDGKTAPDVELSELRQEIRELRALLETEKSPENVS